MFCPFFRYPLFLLFLALSSCLLASPTSPVNKLTGVYYILTESKPYPLLRISLGEVRSIYGQLSDTGCSSKEKPAQKYTTDLNSLFNAVETEEYVSGSILSKNWKQDDRDGKNPFTGSSVTLNISDQAELDIVHTVETYSDQTAEHGSELCIRRHYYELRAVE